jgi:hypothetical protein
LILWALAGLIGLNFVIILYQQPSVEVVTTGFPLAFITNLPMAFWILTIVYSVAGLLVATSRKLTPSQARSVLFISLLMTIFRGALPLLWSKQLWGEDAYMHYLDTRSIIELSSTEGMVTYKSWPGAFVFAAMLQIVGGLDSSVMLAFLPFLLISIAFLTIYLITRELFGQRVALLSVLLISNLTLPVGLNLHFSPFLFASLTILLVLYTKLANVLSNRKLFGFAVVGLILLFATVTAYLILPLFAGVLLLILYLAKAVIEKIVLWVRSNNLSKAMFFIALAIVAMAAMTLERFIVPALILVFLLGVLTSKLFTYGIFSKIGKHLFSKYLSSSFIILLAALSLKHMFLSYLFISLYVGVYVGITIKKKTSDENAVSKPFRKRREDVFNSLTSLAGVALVSTILWWMLMSPETFRMVATAIDAFTAEFRIQGVYSVIGAKALGAEAFEPFDLWHFALINILTLASVLGIYLYTQHKADMNHRAFLMSIGIIAMIVGTHILGLFLAYPERLIPFITLLGVPLLTAVSALSHAKGLRKVAIGFLVAMLTLMATSPLGAYPGQFQVNLFFDQDVAMSQYVGGKILHTNGTLFVGDFRLFFLSAYYNPNISRDAWGPSEDFFERSIWFDPVLGIKYGHTPRPGEYSFNKVDYILLSKSTSNRLLYRMVEPEDYSAKFHEIQQDGSIGKVYNNGYDEVFAVTLNRSRS